MRWRIIAANACIVLLVSLVSYAFLKANLRGVVASPSESRAKVERAVSSAANQIELDSLRLERWLAERVADEGIQAVFHTAILRARSRLATLKASQLQDELLKAQVVSTRSISLVVFVDSDGVSIGRNNSTQMRGEDLGASYPSILMALKTGKALSRLWLNPQRSEQLNVTYAPVLAVDGEVVGAVLIGRPMGDERLARLNHRTDGVSLALGITEDAGTAHLLATVGKRSPNADAPLREVEVLRAAAASLTQGRSSFEASGFVLAAESLKGLGPTGAFLVASVPLASTRVDSALIWPLLASGFLGLLLVAAIGAFLANSISRPIAELETGLLAVINGQANHRFDLEHSEFGGLVSLLNSLLNLVTGVPEVDKRGRTSHPAGSRFRDTD